MNKLRWVSKFVDDVDVAEADHHIRNQNHNPKYYRPGKKMICISYMEMILPMITPSYLWTPPMMVQVPDFESQPIGSNCDATVKRASTTSGWNGFFKDKDGSKDDDVDDDCGDVAYDEVSPLRRARHRWPRPSWFSGWTWIELKTTTTTTTTTTAKANLDKIELNYFDLKNLSKVVHSVCVSQAKSLFFFLNTNSRVWRTTTKANLQLFVQTVAQRFTARDASNKIFAV